MTVRITLLIECEDVENADDAESMAQSVHDEVASALTLTHTAQKSSRRFLTPAYHPFPDIVDAADNIKVSRRARPYRQSEPVWIMR